MTYAFTFDASACTGCKACQVACKDKNNLPVGVLWRRVYEISGGSWEKLGDAWVTDVFAYNLTIACNHCVHPKCAGVCPTDAFVVREDGIVYIDESMCIGCGYCSWACPYDVPQYNSELGRMTKCNFCMDDLDAGLPPACVAACPLRVLDFATIDDGRQTMVYDPTSIVPQQALWELPASEHPFPLPQYSRTEPHLAIQPHTGMARTGEAKISNFEEIRPLKTKSELPLVAFTLLGQMAAGMALFSFFSGPLTAPLLVTLGVLVGASGLLSLLHLGSPWMAWRAMAHLKKSWLSREILVFALFGLSWLLSLVMPGMGKLPLAICGIGLVYSMTQVYRLRSFPAWDTDRTLLSFAASAILLGSLGLNMLDLYAIAAGDRYPASGLLAATGLFLALVLALTDRNPAHQTVRRLRLGMIGLGGVGMLGMFIVPDSVGRWIMVPIFLIVLIEEGIGRWLFYEHLHKRDL